MHSYTYKWRQMSSLYLNVSHLNHSLQWFDLGMKQETVLWVKVLEHGVRNFRMRFSYFSYSSSFSIKMYAPDAKTQKIKPGPISFFLLCRTKVSQTVCKHDWYNIRSYLFFNVWTFRTRCAMALSHWIIHPIDPFRNEARHSLYKSLNPSLKWFLPKQSIGNVSLRHSVSQILCLNESRSLSTYCILNFCMKPAYFQLSLNIWHFMKNSTWLVLYYKNNVIVIVQIYIPILNLLQL